MKLLSVLKKDLLILFRDRAELAVLFLMPLAFIIPISLALGAGDGYGINRGNRMTLLTVVNYDQGGRSQQLLSAIGESLALEIGYTKGNIPNLNLQRDPDCAAVLGPKTTPTPSGTVTPTLRPTPAATLTPGGPTPTATPTAQPNADTLDYPACSEKIARAMLQRSWRLAALIIPPDFSSKIDGGQTVDLTLLYDPGGDATQFQQIEGVVKGATMKISVQNRVNSGLGQLADISAFAPDAVKQSLSQPTTAGQEQQAALRLQKVDPTNYTVHRTPDTYQQTIPGYTVMYVFFIISTLAASINQEKINGTFRRLLSAPISRAELLGGKLLANIVIGLVQVLILFGIGTLAFKLDLGRDPLAFLLLSIALVTAATAMGLAAASFDSKNSWLVAPLILSALLGGCMFPLDLMPAFLRTLSLITPHYWALTGYQNLMVRGQGLIQVLPQIGVLLLFALVFFLIAIRRFDFEK